MAQTRGEPYSRHIGRRIAAAVENETALKALPVYSEHRIEGALTLLKSDGKIYKFVYDSTATASRGVIVPNAGPGRFIQDGIAKVVRLATAAALQANTRTGNVLLANANGAMAKIDNKDPAVGDRVLVKDEVTQANRGIYIVDSLGAAGAKWQMTRAVDWDASEKISPAEIITVSEGDTYTGDVFILTTAAPITLNTTGLAFGRGLGVAAAASIVTRLSDAEDATTSVETRVSDAEDDVTSVETRVSDSEDDITSVETRLSNSEDDVTSVETRVSDAEDDVTSVETRLSDAEDDTTSVETRLSNSEDDVTSVETRLSDAEDDTTSVETRVSDAEDDTTSVETRLSVAEVARPATVRLRLQLTSADLTANALTQTFNLGAPIPSTSMLIGYRINLVDAFDNGGGAATAAVITVGNATFGGAAICSTFNIFTGSPYEGVGWEQGNRAGFPYGAVPEGSNQATQQLTVTVTTTDANVNTLTNGDVTIDAIYMDVV